LVFEGYFWENEKGREGCSRPFLNFQINEPISHS